MGGWVTYANAMKTAQLGVPEELIAEYGAVSEPVAQQMAQQSLLRSGADWSNRDHRRGRAGRLGGQACGPGLHRRGRSATG